MLRLAQIYWAFEVKDNFFKLAVSSNRFELILTPACKQLTLLNPNKSVIKCVLHLPKNKRLRTISL